MSRIIAGCAIAALLMMFAATAWADFDKGDIKDIEASLKAGKFFYEDNNYPDMKSYVQIVNFGAMGNNYIVDFRAHLCFASMAQIRQLIPCSAIKKGYPEIGKLITWEKDGWVE